MANNISIISYNCRGMPRDTNSLYTRPSLQLLFDDPNNDIICVQETWYTKQDLDHLNNLHSSFHGTGAATIDNRDKFFHGHPPGGVSILWRVEYDKCVTPINIGLDWVTGIMFVQGGRKYAVLCICMPYECHANDDSYIEKLGILQSILLELDTTCVSILGDWNGDISDYNSQFAGHLKAFCSDSGLILSDQLLLPNETFTHLSERWHSTSWLAHCISTSDGHSAIVNMEVLYANSCSDHIPITMDVCISNIPVLESNDNDNEPEMYKVDWRVISDADKELYSLNSEALLRNICIPTEALSRKNTSCSNVQQRTDLNVF